MISLIPELNSIAWWSFKDYLYIQILLAYMNTDFTNLTYFLEIFHIHVLYTYRKTLNFNKTT